MRLLSVVALAIVGSTPAARLDYQFFHMFGLSPGFSARRAWPAARPSVVKLRMSIIQRELADLQRFPGWRYCPNWSDRRNTGPTRRRSNSALRCIMRLLPIYLLFRSGICSAQLTAMAQRCRLGIPLFQRSLQTAWRAWHRSVRGQNQGTFVSTNDSLDVGSPPIAYCNVIYR